MDKLDPEAAALEMKRLRESLDLSCMEDVEFMREYVALVDDAYMQQVHANVGMKRENRQLWESNDRIMAELNAEIARLRKELTAHADKST